MSTEKDPRAQQPENLQVGLFNHQLTSLYIMERLENPEFPCHTYSTGNRTCCTSSRLAIMGDIPGFGKSYTMVALILNDRMPCPPQYRKTTVVGSECGLASQTTVDVFPTINCTLLLAGPSLVGQWKEYFAQTPLRVNAVINNRQIEDLDTSRWDVVIVVPTMFNNLVNHAKNVDKFWKRFVYDEPVSIHISNMTFVNACFYWMITASYDDLFFTSKSGMMKTIFRNGRRDFFPVVSNKKSYIEASYKMPDIVYVKHMVYSSNVNKVLQGFITPETANLISAGDISAAVESLGAENFSGNIVEYVSSKFSDAITMYTAKLSAVEMKLNKSDRDAAQIINYKKHIEENSRKRDILQERFATMLRDNDCPICCDKLQEPIMVPCCQNIFCGQCVLTWLKDHDKCPYCRANFQMKDLVHIDKNKDHKSPAPEKCVKKTVLTKPEKVLEIIQAVLERPDARIIVYSMSEKTFSVLTDYLDSSSIAYGILKGCTSTRENLLRDYHQGTKKVLFLNSTYNAAGINLQDTTDIIVYHDMMNSVLDQVVGRAMRVGRVVGNLTVHQFNETNLEHEDMVPSQPAGSSAQHAAGPDMDDIVAIESAMAQMGYSHDEIASFRASQLS